MKLRNKILANSMDSDLSDTNNPSDDEQWWKKMHKEVFSALFLFVLAIALYVIRVVSDFLGTGGANLLLVLVTLAYVILTYLLVEESRASRLEEKQRAREEKKREVETIRKALSTELENLDEDVQDIVQEHSR